MAQEWLEITLPEDIVLPSGKIITLGRGRTRKDRRLYIDGQPTYKFSLDATIGPIHYKDAGDEWQDIDTELVPSTRSIVGFGNPAYEMLENEYEMFVLGALNSGVPLVRYVSKNTDYWVQFAAHNLQWTNDLDQIDFIATPVSTATEIVGNEAKWPDAYGAGLDLRYIAGMGRMGKWLDIASALPDPPQLIIDGGNPVIEFAEILSFHGDLEVYVNGQEWNKKDDVSTATEIEFRADGEIQFVIPVATGYHEGDVEDRNVAGTLHLKKQGNKLYVTARFPWSWLESATYPVHLDTDIDPQPAQVGADADDGWNRATGSDPSASWGITPSALGCLNVSTGWFYDHWYRFTGISGLSGAQIDVAYISLLGYENDGGTPETQIYAEDAEAPAAPADGDDFISRAKTSAETSIPWDNLDLSTGGFVDSPSIVSVIQELADSYDPSAIQIIHLDDLRTDSTNYAAVDDYGNETANAPKLHIEYTAGNGEEYSLVVDAGSYAVSGATTSLLLDWVVSVAAGSYAITGAAAAMGWTFPVAAGSYAISGSAVSLPVGRVMVPAAGTYAISGSAAGLLKARVMSAGASSYAITGKAVSLPIARVMVPAAGTYAITGTAATLLKDLIMQLAGGSYAVTGKTIALEIAMAAHAGSYLLSGTAAEMEYVEITGRGSQDSIWIWVVDTSGRER